MNLFSLALTTAVLTAPLPGDTVLPVERGTRLHVEAARGAVTVQVWERDAVRVRTTGEATGHIGRDDAALRVLAHDDTRGRGPIHLTLTVPRWMDVRVHGQQLEVSVDGPTGEVSIENVAGRIEVLGGASRVSVRTIMGPVTIRGALGRVDVWGVNDSVTIEDVAGEISAETTNGGIVLRRIRAGRVRATTVNGGVRYEGTLDAGGRIALRTHNGRVLVAIPSESSATVSAAAYNGSFRADFPIQLTGMSRDRHYDFTLGSGGARVELESFNGDIILRRLRQGGSTGGLEP
jgi:DUF4097 and DUF4098 domain-containing protein YvlB